MSETRQTPTPDMSRATLGLILVVIGIAMVNYAYLHDIIWQKHAGVIVMGFKSYIFALCGTIIVLAGGILRGTGR